MTPPSRVELAWIALKRVRKAAGELLLARPHPPGGAAAPRSGPPGWRLVARGLDRERHADLLAEVGALKPDIVSVLRWEGDWAREPWDEARVADHLAWAARRYGALVPGRAIDAEAEAAALAELDAARASGDPVRAWRAGMDLLAVAAGAQPEGD
jgi:hypothetical protein